MMEGQVSNIIYRLIVTIIVQIREHVVDSGLTCPDYAVGKTVQHNAATSGAETVTHSGRKRDVQPKTWRAKMLRHLLIDAKLLA